MAARLFFIPKAIPLNTTGGLMSGAKANFFITGTSTRQNTYTLADLATPHPNPVVADGNGVFDAIYLDNSLNYKLDLTDSANISLTGYPIDDLANVTIASDVTVVDAGTHYTATEVEAVLQEIGDDFARKNATGTIGSLWTWATGLQMADQPLFRPLFQDYAIQNTTASSSSNVLTLNIASSNSFETTLTENITTVTISNPAPTTRLCEVVIKIIQDGAAGAYTVTWPASVVWPGGTAPIISAGNDAVDVITLLTYDAGTIWYGNFSQAFA